MLRFDEKKTRSQSVLTGKMVWRLLSVEKMNFPKILLILSTILWALTALNALAKFDSGFRKRTKNEMS